VKIPIKIERNAHRTPADNLLAAVCAAVLLLAAPLYSHASEVSTLNVRQANNEIIVSTAITLDRKIVEDLNSGLSKEFVFKVELYRHVRLLLPNEFITSKTIVRKLQSNPIKREYVGTSIEAGIKNVQRFKDIDSMLAWAVNLPEVKLIGTKGLSEDNYFVAVNAESRAHSLPAVVGYILFFLPSKEFSVSRESALFRVSQQQVAK
jgi:hypothetical protein